MSEDLKPCPWCGRVPDINNPRTFQSNQGSKWGMVVCCGAPEVRTGYDTSDHASWHEDAIAEWNNRYYE